MQNSERRFRSLIENNNDVIALLTADGTIQYQSPAVQRVLGYQPEEVVGQSIFSYLHPDDVAKSSVLFAQALQQPGIATTGQFRCRHKNGHFLWLEGVGTNRLNEPGVQGIVLNHRDITERILAEEARRTQAQVLASISQGVNYVDDDKIIRYTNRAFDQMFGYEPGELLGQRVSVLNDLTSPENTDFVEAVMTALQQHGCWAGEVHNRQKDGTPFLTHASIAGLSMDGEIIWMTVQEDITERKRAEQALRESEERFRSFVEQLAEGVMMTDDQGVITLWNQAQERITGISRSEAVGQPIWQVQYRLLPPDHPLIAHKETYVRNVQAGLSTGQSPQLGLSLEVEIHTPAGERKFIARLAFPIKQGNGYFMGGLVRDITARKRIEEALKTSEEHAATSPRDS